MKTTGFAWVVGRSAVAVVVSGATVGCGGMTATGGGDGGASSGSGAGSSASSSSGTTGSSSGVSGSGSSSGASGSTSGGGGSSGAGSSGSSSGVVSSSGSSGSSGSSSGGAVGGTIYFQQCTNSTSLCDSSQFGFYANFYGSSSGASSCTVTTSGACSAYSCAGSTTTTPPGLSAGTLTISGGSIPAGLTVTPDGTDAYSYTSSSALYSAGQSLTVSATGDTVPAFGPQSVVAPALPDLLAPPATSGAYTIATSTDLGVQWTGGSPGATFVLETAGGGTAGANYFLCEWDASLGQATVPASVLSVLAGEETGFVVYGQYTTTKFNAGPYLLFEIALPYSGGSATLQ